MSKLVIYLNSASYQFYIEYFKDKDKEFFLVNGSFGYPCEDANRRIERVFNTAEQIENYVKTLISTWCILTIANLEPGQAPTDSTFDWTQSFKTLDDVAGDKGTTFVHSINLLMYHAQREALGR